LPPSGGHGSPHDGRLELGDRDEYQIAEELHRTVTATTTTTATVTATAAVTDTVTTADTDTYTSRRLCDREKRSQGPGAHSRLLHPERRGRAVAATR
jgi:hypothetical protein